MIRSWELKDELQPFKIFFNHKSRIFLFYMLYRVALVSG